MAGAAQCREEEGEKSRTPVGPIEGLKLWFPDLVLHRTSRSEIECLLKRNATAWMPKGSAT